MPQATEQAQNTEDDRRLTDQDISPLGRISRPIHRLVLWRNAMKMFLLGVYVTGAAVTFAYVGFLVLLGGKSSADLLLPFACAAAWPVMLPLFLSGRLG